MDKRTFLKTTFLSGIGLLSGFNYKLLAKDMEANKQGTFELPKLQYAYDALEPYIDQKTLEIHHSKHHAGYVNGLNKATVELAKATQEGNFGLVKHWERELAFHGGGHYLHSLYWESMSPKGGKPSAELVKYLNKSFGSVEKFEAYFSAVTVQVEGSGWGVLSYQPSTDKLIVTQLEKHQNQAVVDSIPILACDVWEHAYYLKFQNVRGGYVSNFFEVINWEGISAKLTSLI